MSTTADPGRRPDRRTHRAPGTTDGAGPAPTGASGGTARPAAIGLWVLVAAGLLYGVTQTAIKAGQLFT